MQETNQVQNKSKLPVGRREFIKLTAVGAGVGTATVGSVSITGPVQAAPDVKYRTKGGQIEDFVISGETEFTIEWNDVASRANIYLFLQGKIQGEDNEAIMARHRIPSDESEQATVSISDFTDSDTFGIVEHHDLIDAEDISVDLDNHGPTDDYIRKETFEINVYGFHSASIAARRIDLRDIADEDSANDDADNERGGLDEDDLFGEVDTEADELLDSDEITPSMSVEAILGAGLHFGKEFGVTNSELPEGVI